MEESWNTIESKKEDGEINNFKGVCKNYRGTLLYKQNNITSQEP